MGLDFLQGEPASALTADAEDAAHNTYPLKVEYVGTIPNFDGIYMVVLRLNDLMPSNLGDVLVRLSLHGNGSNRVRVAIGQMGGGPADDSAPNPAPTTPPAVVPFGHPDFFDAYGAAWGFKETLINFYADDGQYIDKASMVVADNLPSGTVVTLTVPYQALQREGDRS